MPLTEPYSALFDAVVTALQTATGPFTATGSVELWCDSGQDELLPDKRLIEALSRTMPHALVSWPGGGTSGQATGGVSAEELVPFRVRYCCGAPGKDYAQALKASGTSYWGAFIVHNWVLDKILPLLVAGYNGAPQLLGMRVIDMDEPGKIGMVVDFQVTRQRTYSD